MFSSAASVQRSHDPRVTYGVGEKWHEGICEKLHDPYRNGCSLGRPEAGEMTRSVDDSTCRYHQRTDVGDAKTPDDDESCARFGVSERDPVPERMYNGEVSFYGDGEKAVCR